MKKIAIVFVSMFMLCLTSCTNKVDECFSYYEGSCTYVGDDKEECEEMFTISYSLLTPDERDEVKNRIEIYKAYNEAFMADYNSALLEAKNLLSE